MTILVTCKNEEDPIKKEGAERPQFYASSFSDAQWQLHVTP